MLRLPDSFRRVAGLAGAAAALLRGLIGVVLDAVPLSAREVGDSSSAASDSDSVCSPSPPLNSSASDSFCSASSSSNSSSWLSSKPYFGPV